MPSTNEQLHFAHPGFEAALKHLASLESVNRIDTAPEDINLVAFVVSTSKYYLPSGKEISIEDELSKFKEELAYQEGFVRSAQKKLSNERFVANAPDAVVAKEQQKLDDGTHRIAILQESIARLEKQV